MGIRFFYPNAYKILDPERQPEFLNTEFNQPGAAMETDVTTKIADVLIKFYTRKIKGDWLIFHFEIQDKYSSNFNSRMITYNLRGRDIFGKLVISCVILTEVTLKKRPDFFKSSGLGNLLYYKYNTYKVSTQSDKNLLADPNPFAIIILSSRIVNMGRAIQEEIKRDEMLMKKKLELFKIVQSRKDLNYKNKNKLLNFIYWYIIIKSKEIKAIFEKELYKINIKITRMGIEQVVLEGMLEEARYEGELRKQNEIITEMLKVNLPDEIIALTTKLPIEKVRSLAITVKNNSSINTPN
ncbi:hypothetical protein ACSBL2_20860 [Pedobacter sp. AW31-3R]|uniref:hypothetical protein n=1 Tax=Pedobacter sp. AW31-3R TaxID=3445781 RepID=UPI003FA071B4